MSFEKEKEFLSNYLEPVERDRVTQSQVDNIISNFNNVPKDFIDYMLEIGSGDLVKSSVKIYPGLCDFDDLGLGDVYELENEIKFFGDNYSGDFIGFDLSNLKDEVVEFWHDSIELTYTGKSFREYIREKMSFK